MTIKFRQMNADDIPFFNRVRNQCASLLHDPSTYTLAQCKKWFENEKVNIFYIVNIDGNDIGYFRTKTDESGKFYVGLDIAEEYRGRGYAVPIYMRFYAEFPELCMYGTYLKVLEKNKIAHRIYEKLGYAEISRSFSTEHGCDDIVMCRKDESVRTDIYDYVIKACNKVFDSSYNDSVVVIHGVNGFVGNWIYRIMNAAKTLHNYDITIYATDIDTLDVRDDIAVTDYYAEITHTHRDKEKTPPKNTIIFNCTGIANPSKYLSMPIDTLDVSYIGTKNILDAARNIDYAFYENTKRKTTVVMFSSSEIYGNPLATDIPSKESKIGILQPESSRACYDVGKLVLEVLCNLYIKNYGVDIRIIRPFNWYGPGMFDNRVIPNMISKAMNSEPIEIYGDGLQTRSFCYVSDAMALLLSLTEKGIKSGVYNIGNDTAEITMSSLASIIKNQCNSQSEIKYIGYPATYPADEPARRAPNMLKTFNVIDKHLGFSFTDLRNGIQNTIIGNGFQKV